MIVSQGRADLALLMASLFADLDQPPPAVPIPPTRLVDQPPEPIDDAPPEPIDDAVPEHVAPDQPPPAHATAST